MKGLPEPRPKAGAAAPGLSHPAEFAASIAYARESRFLAEAAGRGSAAPQSKQSAATEEPWWKRKKREKAEAAAYAKTAGAVPK